MERCVDATNKVPNTDIFDGKDSVSSRRESKEGNNKRV